VAIISRYCIKDTIRYSAIPMQAADKSDAIVIAVNRDGRTWLGTTQTPAADLAPKVKDLLTNRLDKTVFVKSDARARYEKVVEVVNNLRSAGVDQLGLLTEQIQDKTTRPAAAPEAAPAAQ
jgi:biopolymer transport protein ExbD/biopolymer transport protein TolR